MTFETKQRASSFGDHRNQSLNKNWQPVKPKVGNLLADIVISRLYGSVKFHKYRDMYIGVPTT